MGCLLSTRLSLSLLLALVVGALGVGPAAAQDRLSIATGGTGGVYYPYGGAMANVLSDNIEGIEVTAEVTAASVDNMLFIESRDADIAFTLGDTAYDAVQGNAPFMAAVPAVALATLYNNYTHIVTTTDGGINSVADLRDKRVSTGAPGSGTEVIANRILAAAGLDPENDIEREQLGAAESADAVKDGQLDAFFWSGGLPTAAITDLGATPNVGLKLLPSAEYVEQLAAEYGAFYSVATIPASTYTGQDEAVDVIVVPNLLVVHAEMDEQLAYEIVRVIFEQRDQLILAHPEANNLTLENATVNSPIAYHPGAIRYFQEQGIEIAPPATPAA